MRMVAFVLTWLLLAVSSAHPTELARLGSPFGEAYRAKFAECDAKDTFGGVPVRRLHRCTTDPSRFERLARVPPTDGASGAVIIVSKMAHDDDGSARSCSAAHGSTSQCPTTLMLPATAAHPCKMGRKASECVPTDPDTVPYVVLPGGSGRELGLSVGDYGMVVLGGRRVPAIIADLGPSNKIGEGSTFLLSRLSTDGHVHTVDHGAIYVLFPGSADPRADLSPDTLPALVERKATALYDAFRASNP